MDITEPEFMGFGTAVPFAPNQVSAPRAIPENLYSL